MDKQIRNNAIKGMAWTGLGGVTSQGVQFLIGLLIARLLLPSDYGIIGMLAIFVGISHAFLDSGFTRALVQKKNCTAIDFSTAFCFNFVIAVLLYGLIFISAPYIADFYRMPIIKDVARVLSLTIIINSFSIVQTAILTIGLDFRQQSLAYISASIISCFVGLLLAYLHYGVWALVYQNITMVTIRLAIFWRGTRWIPSFVFSSESFRGLFAFGSKLLFAELISTIYRNVYTMVIGKCFTPADVGLYTRGDHLALFPAKTVSDMIRRVNFPILSKLQNDNNKMVEVYNNLLKLPMFLYLPLMFGLLALSRPLVSVVLGEKWVSCIPYFQILIFAYIWFPLSNINITLLYAKGRSDLVLKLELVIKIISIMILFLLVPFGIRWMCVGQAVMLFFTFISNCYYTNKLLNYGIIQQMKEILPIVIYSLLMFVTIKIVMLLFVDNLCQLLFGGIVGFLFYPLVSLFFKDSSMLYILDYLKNKNSCNRN